MNKTYIIGSFLIMGFAVFLAMNLPQDEVKTLQPTNYQGLIKLGLAPSSDMRYVTKKDIDTGLRYEFQGYEFGLFESRNWNTLDYGKTFISPISR